MPPIWMFPFQHQELSNNIINISSKAKKEEKLQIVTNFKAPFISSILIKWKKNSIDLTGGFDATCISFTEKKYAIR